MRRMLKTPKDGDIRIKTSFLFFPKVIEKELRWMEKSPRQQKYIGDL